MKREIKEKYTYGVSKIFPIFSWKKCIKCKKGFKFEWGYSFLGGPFYNGGGRMYDICNCCAPTRDDAHKIAINYISYIPRPPRPQPIFLKKENI